MENFVPVSAIVGGGLIGLSAAVPWVANGRIAGISGIVGGMLAPLSADFAWRSAFVASLMVAPMSYRFAGAPLTDLNSEGAAIAALALGAPKSVAFVGAMLAGMALFTVFDLRTPARGET